MLTDRWGGRREAMEFGNGGSSSSERRAAAEGATLARQGSVYSLTFDEFQSALAGGGGGGGGGSGFGKDFGSMNMDELLRSIWTAEESQAMASASGSAAGVGVAVGAPPTSLQRQGSLTLPRTLSAKTVDEVWRNLVRDEPPPVGAADGGDMPPQRQSTLGEMTLEEFLVRAGVVRENPPAAPPPVPPPMPPRPVPVVPKTTAFLGNFPGANDAGAAALGFAPLGMGDPALGNGLMPRAVPVGLPGAAVAMQTAVNQFDSGDKGNSDLSSPTEPMPYSFEGLVRGRRNGGGVEKVVERRQRRMIKNRESAARSRARKQAYTLELEAEVQKLKEMNKELERKQADIMEMQKNEVEEMIKDPFGRRKRLCLRRTLTGPW
ncbi:bZIP transcription factor TRAB1-like [Oryza sativa Japonica Group]|jgi:ABA responsive element binding factor|uniref:BZIP transcription factor ABI5 n=2 Tax=Oryza sativa subsp. japonica TaxID=39947 RepID=A0A0P0XMS6_ORYSJ|nr:bZIP transcription factor TRAB1-like [Oryza sativa Japonica Group]KAF2916521.1 hypothetical protein DAI22_09g125500 [Oryza sativa Japonica Group]BAD38293.1 putative bZIP transcription factor ABI5 [Oryza sativa Japonica Group]BAD38466.1 putative bZIP transcription factor ABI5 [Oryza sativa Japonica Group]BAF25276.1 Os09g0456200 [Oryza sativa Japonica Group]BAG89716.1 unnamed protein product [Oryza sativa Japonica Group]|eukprot:NP_001063362.1 Os09g0456200 [Oryza sativa Japonica Group]